MAIDYKQCIIRTTANTLTLNYHLSDNLSDFTFYIASYESNAYVNMTQIDILQSEIDLTSTPLANKTSLNVFWSFSNSAYNTSSYVNLFYRGGSTTPKTAIVFDTTYNRFKLNNTGLNMSTNPITYLMQTKKFTENGIGIIYDYDNPDYIEFIRNNITNPTTINANSYFNEQNGMLYARNNALLLTAKVITKSSGNDSTSSFSINSEQTQATPPSKYVIGSEYYFVIQVTSKVVSNVVNVTQALTNCTSSINTPTITTGSYTITLTANNDTVFRIVPTANYNNVDYTFTLNSDSTIATLNITLDVADITLTINGSAVVVNLQGISNFYKPTLEELQYISNHRYKWLSGEYSSERIDLGEYILNLKTVYCPLSVRTTEKVTLGGNELDLYVHPLNNVYIDLETPNQLISGYYGNNFDVKNITSFYALIPFYNIYELDREYINHNIKFGFHIDLSNCDVTISIYVDNKLVDTLKGDCSIDIPYIMEKSLTPKTECFIDHLKIVVNEKTNCNNRIKTIKNDTLSHFTGFVRGEIVTDSIKATSQELTLLKQLFNEGVYNG